MKDFLNIKVVKQSYMILVQYVYSGSITYSKSKININGYMYTLYQSRDQPENRVGINLYFESCRLLSLKLGESIFVSRLRLQTLPGFVDVCSPYDFSNTYFRLCFVKNISNYRSHIMEGVHIC